MADEHHRDSFPSSSATSGSETALKLVLPSGPLHSLLHPEPQYAAGPAGGLPSTTAVIRKSMFPLEIESVTVTTAQENSLQLHHACPPRAVDALPLWSNTNTTTTGLGERLIGDVAVAAIVTAAAAPFLSIIDQALVQRAAGTSSFVNAARSSATAMMTNPAAYLRSPAFRWMWATYAATYSTANGLRSITEQQEYRALGESPLQYERQQRTTQATLFLGTTVVNSAASMAKDRAYAQLFGGAATATAAPAIPKVSYGLWMARDLTVIGSSFVLPSYVAQQLRNHYGVSEAQAQTVAQIATPMAAQLIAGPLHYVGLDCCTRPSLPTASFRYVISDRLYQLQQAIPEVVLARMLRILPGYGIAGVCNTSLRNQYRDYLVEQRVQKLLRLQHEKTVAATTTATVHTATLPTNATAASAVTTDLASLLRGRRTTRTGGPTVDRPL